MTESNKFKLFFPTAVCRQVGRQYVVTCYNYHLSCDKIEAEEALTAEKAWSNTWQSFKRGIFNALSHEYTDPWLELPNGLMIIALDNEKKWSWEEFRDDPSVRHLWINILQPPPRKFSVLDLVEV